MGMLVNPYRHLAAASSGLIADLFANGEIGDYWRFDVANTDANAVLDEITTATGTVNGLVMSLGDVTKKPSIVDVGGVELTNFSNPSDRLLHSFAAGTVAQPGTIILGLHSATDIDSTIVYCGSAAGSRWQLSIDGSGNIIIYAGSTLDSTRDRNFGTKVITAEFNGASSRVAIKGEGVNSSATGDAGTQGTNRITIGSSESGTAGAGFDCSALLFINRLLTPAELDGVELLIGSYHALSW